MPLRKDRSAQLHHDTDISDAKARRWMYSYPEPLHLPLLMSSHRSVSFRRGCLYTKSNKISVIENPCNESQHAYVEQKEKFHVLKFRQHVPDSSKSERFGKYVCLEHLLLTAVIHRSLSTSFLYDAMYQSYSRSW